VRGVSAAALLACLCIVGADVTRAATTSPDVPLASAQTATVKPSVLRVCADPNNLPFSNAAGEGFENRLMTLLATELRIPLRYTWVPQRRGFLRNTLESGRCDVVPGIASAIGRVATTRPVYRSTYVFVTRAGTPPPAGFDDTRLRTLRVGVQLVGDDGANTPPAHALAARGIRSAVVGYPVYGDYRGQPQARILDAVAKGDIDVAVVWGPVAGYFAKGRTPPLVLSPVSPWLDGPQWPMRFDVSLGVRKEDIALRRALDRALSARSAEVDALLEQYGLPLVDDDPGPAGLAAP
jgi:mxaJ protein